MSWKVTCSRLDGKGETSADLKQECILGRTRSSLIPLPSTHISREQCVLKPTADGSGWTIEDNGSMNGTHLNGVKLTAKTKKRLTHGDVVVVGLMETKSSSFQLIFTKTAAETLPETTPKPKPPPAKESIATKASGDEKTNAKKVSEPNVVEKTKPIMEKGIPTEKAREKGLDIKATDAIVPNDVTVNNLDATLDTKLSQKPVVIIEDLSKEKMEKISEDDEDAGMISDDCDIIFDGDPMPEEKSVETAPTTVTKLDADETLTNDEAGRSLIDDMDCDIIEITSKDEGEEDDKNVEVVADVKGLKRTSGEESDKLNLSGFKRMRIVSSTSSEASPSPTLITDDDSDSDSLLSKNQDVEDKTDRLSPSKENVQTVGTKANRVKTSSNQFSDDVSENIVPEVKQPLNGSSKDSFPASSLRSNVRQSLAALMKEKRIMKIGSTSSADGRKPVNTVTAKPRSGRPTFDETETNMTKLLARKREMHASNLVKDPRPKPSPLSKKPPPNRPGPASRTGSPVTQNKPHTREPPRQPANNLEMKLKPNVSGNNQAKPVRTVKVPIDNKVNTDLYICDIVNWECRWFKEFRDKHEEPPIAPPIAFKDIKMNYETLEDYINTNVPYIYSEIWANLMESYVSVKTRHSSPPKCCMLIRYEVVGNFILVSLQTAINKNALSSPDFFSEGDVGVVAMELEGVQQDGSVGANLLTLAYISDLTSSPLSAGVRAHLSKRIDVPKHCDTVVSFQFKMKKRSIRIDGAKPIRMQKLAYVRPQLRLIESLVHLRRSYLKDSILKPRKMTCNMAIPTVRDLRMKEYNESQNKAILGSIEAVSRPPSIAKILLIQGPPGTGKTHTLIGIVKKLFSSVPHKGKTPKILICAPSNGAVDEISRRLYRVRSFMQEAPANRPLRIVRTGQMSHISSELHSFALDHLVEKNVRACDANYQSVYDTKARRIEDQMQEMDVRISNLRALNKIDSIMQCESELIKLGKELDRLKKQKDVNAPFEGNIEARKHHMRDEILRKSDVILCTLNSCRQSALERIFQNDRANAAFDCVIIDEASQCSEPEILMPLFYTSISKMILIGDPMQLPATVKSKRAADMGYGRSLFERFFEAFGGYKESDNPVLMLDEQYRMHQEICQFPAKKFYDNRLRSHPTAGIHPNFPLRPYTVLDVLETVQSTSDPKNIHNEAEAMFVLTVCRVLCRSLKHNSSIGIITPYQGQKRLLQKMIGSANLPIAFDVNTIDGFQGQEKDVIILSCVRSFENGQTGGIGFLGSTKRLNVALTRARYALVACVSKGALDGHPLWKEFLDDALQRKHFYKMNASASLDSLSKLLVTNKTGQRP
ncbi:putative helicase senataxin [Halotydeus destructor]|nr:putative helicase senataxin [Halotydeus destructor]